MGERLQVGVAEDHVLHSAEDGGEGDAPGQQQEGVVQGTPRNGRDEDEEFRWQRLQREACRVWPGSPA